MSAYDPRGFDVHQPIPLSDEDRDDWGGGCTYVGPNGPELNRLAARLRAVAAKPPKRPV